MAWVTPTSDSLKLRMAADWPQLDRAAKQNGVTMADVVSGVLGDVVSLVRGYVQGNPDNTMGAEGSIPPETSHAFYTLARLAMIATIPGGTALADDVRKEHERNAYAFLNKVASGDIRISPADDSAADPPSNADGVYTGDEPLAWDNDTVTNA